MKFLNNLKRNYTKEKNKKLKGIISKLLACTLLISLSTGCSSNSNTSDTDVNIGSSQSANSLTVNKVQNPSDAEIHFIDTGNSDAILIKKDGEYAMIDGGDNDDENLVVNYLKKQNVDKLKYLFATHPDADHIGGLDAVVDNIEIENVFVSNGDANTKTYRDFITALANKGLNPSVPLLNSEFKLGDATFKVISVANTKDPNNNSLVLLFTNQEDRILLMGDAEKEIEETLLNIGKVDLLKVGHHGSSSSSTIDFIHNINPDYSVILCGKNNRYGHPHRETLETLNSVGTEIHRSDVCGDIVFISTGNGVWTDCDNSNSSANTKVESFDNSTTNNTYNSNNVESNNNTINSSNNNEDVVYWTPNGEVYHLSKDCPSLARSKVINKGTIEESGKPRAHKGCN